MSEISEAAAGVRGAARGWSSMSNDPAVVSMVATSRVVGDADCACMRDAPVLASTSSTPHDITLARSGSDGTRGFGADARYWETVMPRLSWIGDTVTGIELVPITLRQTDPFHRRGRPRLARDAEARSILDRFAALSSAFGTRMTIRDGMATVELPG